MTRLASALCWALLLAGCGAAAGTNAAPSTAAGVTSSNPPNTGPPASATPPPTAAPRPGTPPRPTPGGGPIVVLDPGHNGGNAGALTEINLLVPAGRGRRKPCNTTGTSTSGGYPEHAFSWDVAQRVRAALTGQGVAVVLTRPDDGGVGPCVDERAAIGNRAAAAVVVSIHADGSTAPGAHGFHVAYSSPALTPVQAGPASSLAATLRDTLRDNGFLPANYLGSDGLDGRDDLAGLNLSTVPAALVECANMLDAAEAAVVSSPAGRQRYATAITTAILRWLAR